MKNFKRFAVGAFLLVGALPLSAQFNSGSDGTFGAITLASDDTRIIAVPDDGIIHATTVTIGRRGHLRFVKNALNTPVYLLATGDIVMSDGDGSISVDGAAGTDTSPGTGGPGGFDGGAPGVSGAAGGAGLGPGGGLGGSIDVCSDSDGDTTGGGGAYGRFPASVSLKDGQVYGSSLLIPLVGGSGGGGTKVRGGGGGGGALVIASSTLIHFNGQYHITARGGSAVNCPPSSLTSPNGGSGGSVRLIAPRITSVSTASIIHVHGGVGGGDGRARIDTLDRTGSTVTFNPPSAGVYGTFMQVFPTTTPSLDITSVAGTAIAKGAPNAVSIVLPVGSSSSQSVTIEATNFTGSVPFRVVVTPETGGDPGVFDGTITVPGGATTATATLNVTIPVNVPVKIHAWTR